LFVGVSFWHARVLRSIKTPVIEVEPLLKKIKLATIAAVSEKDQSMTRTIVAALVAIVTLTSPMFAQGIQSRAPETFVIAGQRTTIPLLTLTQAMDLTTSP
jgi:hypothetical protein